jgi:hypothetical protein
LVTRRDELTDRTPHLAVLSVVFRADSKPDARSYAVPSWLTELRPAPGLYGLRANRTESYSTVRPSTVLLLENSLTLLPSTSVGWCSGGEYCLTSDAYLTPGTSSVTAAAPPRQPP